MIVKKKLIPVAYFLAKTKYFNKTNSILIKQKNFYPSNQRQNAKMLFMNTELMMFKKVLP